MSIFSSLRSRKRAVDLRAAAIVAAQAAVLVIALIATFHGAG